MTGTAMIDDERGSEAVDEAGRPSTVLTAPCLACGRTTGRRRRRGCCITCYRKFQECGVALPMPPPLDLPRWLMDRMSAAQRTKALAHLRELVAAGPDPSRESTP